MRIVRTTVGIAHVARTDERLELHDVRVDTRSAYDWFPRPLLEQLGITPQRVERFETADGRVIERNIGFAMLYAGGRSSPTTVVFAEQGDITLLGAFGLEGLNLRVDLTRRELVPAGPIPAAGARAA